MGKLYKNSNDFIFLITFFILIGRRTSKTPRRPYEKERLDNE